MSGRERRAAARNISSDCVNVRLLPGGVSPRLSRDVLQRGEGQSKPNGSLLQSIGMARPIGGVGAMCLGMALQDLTPIWFAVALQDLTPIWFADLV